MTEPSLIEIRFNDQKKPGGHGWTADALPYVLPPIKNWWPFCSEQLQGQTIYQNAQIFRKNWLIPSSPAISIQNLKKKWKWHGCTSFLGSFYSSWRPSQISPTADFDGAAIPPPIFSMRRIDFQSGIKFELSNIPFHYHMLFPHIRHKKVKVLIKLHLLFLITRFCLLHSINRFCLLHSIISFLNNLHYANCEK